MGKPYKSLSYLCLCILRVSWLGYKLILVNKPNFLRLIYFFFYI